MMWKVTDKRQNMAREDDALSACLALEAASQSLQITRNAMWRILGADGYEAVQKVDAQVAALRLAAKGIKK